MIYQLITPEGLIEKKEIEYVVIYKEDGQLAILDRHIPIIVNVEDGYVKIVLKDTVEFVYLERAVIEFKQHTLSIIAVEAKQGKTIEEAKSQYQQDIKLKIEQSKKANVDYSKQERDLKENITKSRAGRH